MRWLGLILIAACSAQPKTTEAALPGVVGKVDEGRELIGTTPPDLGGVEWNDGRKHPVDEDRGKVVLVRWWTDGCPLCRNSAPAVRALQAKHGDALVVRAIYHNKRSDRPVDKEGVAELASQVGFGGVVGQDHEWAALRRWWLDGNERSFTSVTFLLDKRGRVALIHTGGEFHRAAHTEECLFDPAQCAREYEAVDKAIGALKEEPGSDEK